VLAALSTSHKIGLGVVGLIFITFALASSFLGPRWKPDFPGERGIKIFIVISFVLFFSMVAAVFVFGAEASKKVAVEHGAAAAATGKLLAVTEDEFHVILASKKVPPGSYTFVVTNKGKIQHDLAVQGGAVNTKTPLIDPGKVAKLTVTLPAGTYTLYCTVPGHRAAGMVTKLVVG
jgi:uncharacterized cupredoxin-like copper-binding protein